MKLRFSVIFSCALLVAAAPAIAGSIEPLKFLKRTDIPGYTGDFDHMAVDIRGNRLFMAAEDHGTVEVFNLTTLKHEQTLKIVDTPHAFFFVPGTDRMIITDSGKDMSPIVDLKTLKVLGHIKLAPGADSSEYDPSTGHFYIVTGGGDVGMKVSYLNEIDSETGKVLRRLKFDSDHTEALRIEQKGDRIFVNLADKNEVAVVNKKTLKLITTWPIKGASTNLCMALDEAHHRLFVVTRNPTKMFVLDTDNGSTVATVDVPAVVDGLFFDKNTGRIYVPGAVGEVGVYQEVDPDHYRELARVPTAKGAKSGVYVPQINRFFAAASPGKRVGGAVLEYAVEK